MTITEYLETQRKSTLLVLGALLFLAVVAGDYLTHAIFGLEFALFYLVPISFFSWFIGRRAGVVLAIASVAFSYFIRLGPLPRAIAYWDAVAWMILFVGSAIMIAQLKRLYAHERYLSRIDPLTKVENRRAFFDSVERAKSFSDRHHAPLSLAYLDLDNFKRVNDNMGHIIGDDILAAVAAGIRKGLRPTDTVARLGGDEFALLLPETDKETAVRILDRVRAELDRSMRERQWPVTFSIGVVSFSPPFGPVPQMIDAADQTMYAAKSQGKNRMETFISAKQTQAAEKEKDLQ